MAKIIVYFCSELFWKDYDSDETTLIIDLELDYQYEGLYAFILAVQEEERAIVKECFCWNFTTTLRIELKKQLMSVAHCVEPVMK